MLILSRRPGETVVIGDDIFITIARINGNQIKLGFDVPKDVAIHRREIWLKIQEEKTKSDVSNKSMKGAERCCSQLLKGANVITPGTLLRDDSYQRLRTRRVYAVKKGLLNTVSGLP